MWRANSATMQMALSQILSNYGKTNKTKHELNITACLWFALKAVHSPVSSSSTDLILSLLINYSSVLYSEWPFKRPGEVNCLAIPPHPGNQTQIENIQPPISVRLSIFPACQCDVTFPAEPPGCEGGDNVSGLWMRFEFHGPISLRVHNCAICIL